MASLYETDFYGWTQEQASTLRRMLAERANTDLDLENIAEEIDSLGRSDYSQLVSRLEEICIHLLRLHYSPVPEPRNGWRNSIKGQRYGIRKLLKKSPSLKPRLHEALIEGYEDALRHFNEERLISLTMPSHLPDACPFELDEVMRDDWWPEEREAY